MKKSNKTIDIFSNNNIGEDSIKARKEYLLGVKNLNFSQKLKIAKGRIREFIKYCKDNKLGEPVVSFSGGKDSCVVKHLVEKILKHDVKLLTATELFHPDNAKLLKLQKNIEIFPPKMSFDEIIKKHGYPVISKETAQKINAVRNCKTNGKWIRTCLGIGKGRKIAKKYLHFLDKNFVKYEITNKCCDLLKGPIKHDKRPKFTGVTIFESKLRRTNWIRKGCNVLNVKHPQSRPISLWTHDDVQKYIKKNNITISEAYDKGWNRTGCVACGFGLSFECQLAEHDSSYKNRLELLKQYYPNTYNNYIYKLNMKEALIDSYIKIPSDNLYMKEYELRERERERWYSNLRKNILKILSQIEKNTKRNFSDVEKSNILKGYGV